MSNIKAQIEALKQSRARPVYLTDRYIKKHKASGTVPFSTLSKDEKELQDKFEKLTKRGSR